MKKIIALLLAVITCALAFASCGATTVETSATESSTAETTKFILGFDAEFPPYGFLADDGTYTGFDLELAAELCSRRGWELVTTPINWDAKDTLLNTGVIDCIWNGFTMTGREDEYTWTVPYVDNSQVIVVKADSGITKLEDLADKRVSVQAASSALDALNSEDNAALTATFGKLVEYPDYNTCFSNLELDMVDAVALDIGVAKYQINSRSGEYVILDEQISTEQYAIGFKKGNTELRDLVQETLLEMVADGTFAKIAAKYADYGIPDCVCLG